VKQDLRLVCRASPTAKITSLRTINSDRLPLHLHHLLQKELQLAPDVRQDLKLARRAYLTALSFIIKDRQGLISSLEAAAPNGGNYSSTSHRSGSPIIIVNIFTTVSCSVSRLTVLAYCNTQRWHTVTHSLSILQHTVVTYIKAAIAPSQSGEVPYHCQDQQACCTKLA